MNDYISGQAFIERERKRYCENCERRQGIKNGKLKMVYDIGDAPCRACSVNDMFCDIEDFPAADVVPVVRCKDCKYWEHDVIFFEGWCRGKRQGNPMWYCADGLRMDGEEE